MVSKLLAYCPQEVQSVRPATIRYRKSKKGYTATSESSYGLGFGGREKGEGKKYGLRHWRGNRGKGELIVVAGDGRRVSDKFRAPDGGDKPARGQGNPMAHAVIRAIALVARKRRDLLAQYSPSVIGEDAGRSLSADTGWQEDRFLDKPLTALEREIYDGGSMKSGGYLCVDMDIYITHEPCIMCSMAILHSRFGNVVYGSRRVGTGALSAEREDIDIISGVDGPGRGLGYGLFWRQELNWRLLAWQWLDDDDDEYGYLECDTHV